MSNKYYNREKRSRFKLHRNYLIIIAILLYVVHGCDIDNIKKIRRFSSSIGEAIHLKEKKKAEPLIIDGIIIPDEPPITKDSPAWIKNPYMNLNSKKRYRGDAPFGERTEAERKTAIALRDQARALREKCNKEFEGVEDKYQKRVLWYKCERREYAWHVKNRAYEVRDSIKDPWKIMPVPDRYKIYLPSINDIFSRRAGSRSQYKNHSQLKEHERPRSQRQKERPRAHFEVYDPDTGKVLRSEDVY